MRNITLEILFRWFDVCDSFWSLGEKLWFRWTFLMMSCRLISRLSASPTDWRVVCRQAAVYFNESKYNKRESRKRHRETREKFPFLMFSRKTPLCWGGERRRDTTKHTAKKKGERRKVIAIFCACLPSSTGVSSSLSMALLGWKLSSCTCVSPLFSLCCCFCIKRFLDIFRFTTHTLPANQNPNQLTFFFMVNGWLLPARALCI